MAETIENLLLAIASPVALATKAFTGPALQYLPGLIGFFAVSFAVSYVAWGMYGLSGKKRGTLSSCDISILHGLLTCTLGFWQLSSNFPFSLDAPNNASTNLIMQLSAVSTAELLQICTMLKSGDTCARRCTFPHLCSAGVLVLVHVSA
ncbi:hypothetical protein ABBQ38_000597 [Trebouxia sp. C0009 RCD-2024]